MLKMYRQLLQAAWVVFDISHTQTFRAVRLEGLHERNTLKLYFSFVNVAIFDEILNAYA